MEIEPIYRIMTYQKQDILDTLESTLSPYLSIALDSQLPLSIPMFRIPLPTSDESFQALVTKCTSVSGEFTSFTIQSNFTISCCFRFNAIYSTFVVVKYDIMQQIDLTILQKRLSALKFSYTIPYSHLSFAIPNTAYKFVYNSSYSHYITDDGED